MVDSSNLSDASPHLLVEIAHDDKSGRPLSEVIMNRRTLVRILPLSVGVALLSGAQIFADDAKDEKKPEAPKLTGTVEFKGEAAFGKDTIVKVILADVSLQDVAAKVLGEQIIKDAKKFPVEFAVEYDASKIREGFMYAVQVRIETNGKLDYITDTTHLVLNGNRPKKDVKIPVIKVK